MNLSLFDCAKDEGTALWFLNSLTFIKATAKQTGGAFGLIEQVAPPGPASPYHVHVREDESFYIIEGQLAFVSGARRLTHGPGSLVFLPRNIPHGFAVIGDSPARFLVMTTPGGFEEFIMEMATPAKTTSLPPVSAQDMAGLTRIAAKYGIDVLGPLPPANE